MEKIIKIFKNVDELSRFFAQMLAAGIGKTPEGQYFSIALSGGSTPKRVFEFLALHYRSQIDWQKVLVFWSDERCVDPESEESNYKMAKDSLLNHVPVPAENIFRIKGETAPGIESLRYSEVIKQHVPGEHNIPRFDLLMLGLGEDGHTVSVFPGNLHLFNSDKFCEVAENPYSKQKRITLTGKIINQAKTVIFIVTGDSKAEMVARVIEKQAGWEMLPASWVSPQNGKLYWLLDEKSAAKLTV